MRGKPADRIDGEPHALLRRHLEVVREHLDLLRRTNELLAE